VKNVYPEVDVEESVVAKTFDVSAEEYDTGNSNAEVGAESSYESSEIVSIRGVGGGFRNSTVEESYCVMDFFAGTS